MRRGLKKTEGSLRAKLPAGTDEISTRKGGSGARPR